MQTRGDLIRREAQDERNNRKLIAALAGMHDRRAHYYCVIVLVRHPEDPEPLIAEGRRHVSDPHSARKKRFWLRSLFLRAAFGRTTAELEPSEKNSVSHRALALR